MHLTEEHLKENPNLCAYMAPSLDARQDMVVIEVPKLGKEAATKAIKEWGQPKSKITHLVAASTWRGHTIKSPTIRPSPIRQTPHDVPTRLLRRWHGSSTC